MYTRKCSVMIEEHTCGCESRFTLYKDIPYYLYLCFLNDQLDVKGNKWVDFQNIIKQINDPVDIDFEVRVMLKYLDDYALDFIEESEGIFVVCEETPEKVMHEAIRILVTESVCQRDDGEALLLCAKNLKLISEAFLSPSKETLQGDSSHCLRDLFTD